MKITKTGHKKMRLLNEKNIKEKLMKKTFNDMVWLKKQQKKLMNQIVNFDELECEKSLNIISEFYLKVKENLIIWSK